jgi:3-oxoadipate enol-lactonase
LARDVILSNALGTTAALWDAQLDALAAFHVVRSEHRPRSSVAALAQDVFAQADELGIARFSLCGVSLGGMVGMWLALEAPERIDRLVLVSTAARFGEPAEWREGAAQVRAEGMGAVAEDALDKWLTWRYRDREPFLRMQLDTPPEDYACGLEAIGGFDVRDRIGAISAPTLVVAGAEDVATTPADAAFLAAGIPNARLVVLAECAHLPNVEQPAAFNAALLEHLG